MYGRPAYGKKCHNCSKSGRFAKYCLSNSKKHRQRQNVNNLNTGGEALNPQTVADDTDDEFIFTLGNKQK